LLKVERLLRIGLYEAYSLQAGASKGTPDDAKWVTEILMGDKNKDVRGYKI